MAGSPVPMFTKEKAQLWLTHFGCGELIGFRDYDQRTHKFVIAGTLGWVEATYNGYELATGMWQTFKGDE